MNGRVYDPFLARMISADPTVPGPFNGQAFNRYAYVFNNPLGLVDPSGFCADNADDVATYADGAGGDEACYPPTSGVTCTPTCEPIQANDGECAMSCTYTPDIAIPEVLDSLPVDDAATSTGFVPSSGGGLGLPGSLSGLPTNSGSAPSMGEGVAGPGVGRDSALGAGATVVGGVGIAVDAGTVAAGRNSIGTNFRTFVRIYPSGWTNGNRTTRAVRIGTLLGGSSRLLLGAGIITDLYSALQWYRAPDSALAQHPLQAALNITVGVALATNPIGWTAVGVGAAFWIATVAANEYCGDWVESVQAGTCDP